MEPSRSDLEQRLSQAEEALERSERLATASRYAGAIMYEVNNPLEAITNLVYLTKIEKDDPARVFENMGVIEEQLLILGRVTRQALTFHRENSDAANMDLTNIANAALKLHADKLSRHGITVDRRFYEPAVATVRGSEILQVVSNLILNAVDAPPKARGRICIGVRTSGKAAHLTVCDDGPGIPREFAYRLFEPYVTSKKSGTGLGLWLSLRIITKHHGTLRFRTRCAVPSTGTVFRLSLPLASAA